MKHFLLSLFFIMFVGIGFSQTASFTWQVPTCIAPSNGRVTVTITGTIGNVEYVLLNTNNGVSISSDTITNTTYQFTGLIQGAAYVCYVNNTDTGNSIGVSNKTLTAIPYKATTSRIKGAGCLGECVGSVDVTIVGGIAPYTISWNAGVGGLPDTTVLVDICPNNYTATITDNIGCIINSTTTAIVPEDVIISKNILGHVLCKEKNTGSVSVSATNGTGEFIYKWYDNSIGIQHDTLPAGNHYAVAIDEIGCTDTAFFTITEPANKIDVVLDSKVDILCKGFSTGQANVSTLFGNAPLSYAWSDGGSGNTRTALISDVYKVVVTDNTQCKDSIEITLNEPATYIQGSIDASSMPLCNGDINGTATISASGGTPGYTFLWDDPLNDSTKNNAVRTDLRKFNYSIVFFDNNGCKDTLELNLDEPDILSASIDLLDNTLAPDTVACFGNTMDVKINTSGGTLPMQSFIWDTPGNPDTNTLTIGAGTYQTVVTDNNGCQITLNKTITEPNLLVSLVAILTPIECKGDNGEINSSVSGGVAPYSYLWSNTNTTSTSGLTPADDYTVTITDRNGCENIETITLPEPATYITGSIDTFTQPLCNGDINGTATISATGGTGGISYLWNDPLNDSTKNNSTRTDLRKFNYSIVFTDDNGCTDTLDLNLDEPDILSASIDLLDNTLAPDTVACFGNTMDVKINTSGGTLPMQSFIWDTPGNPDTNTLTIGAGTYQTVVTDNNGCQITLNKTITEPILLISSVAILTPIECKGDNGEINSSVSGGVAPYTYLWSNTNTTSTSGLTPADDYTVTITDRNGCENIESITLPEPATSIIGSVDAFTQPLCYGDANGTATVSATGGTGGYTLTWDDPSAPATIHDASRTDLISRLYSITFEDANGCTNTQTLDLLQPDTLEAFLSLLDDSTIPTSVPCYNNTFDIKVTTTGGTGPMQSYVWDAPLSIDNQNVTIGDGNYRVVITDANNCIADVSLTLTEPTLLVTSIDISDTIKCKGNTGEISTSASGGTSPYFYNWSNGSTSSTSGQTIADDYSVIISDNNGCENIETKTLPEPATSIVGSIDSNTEPLCFGDFNGTATVSATGGTGSHHYLWDDPSNDSTKNNSSRIDLGSRLYTITFSDDNGCTDIKTLDIQQPAKLVAEILLLNNDPVPSALLCFEDSIDVYVKVTGGTNPIQSFNWDAPTLPDLSTVKYGKGNYVVDVTDFNNCVASTSHNLSEPALLECTLMVVDSIDCKDSTGIIGSLVTGGTMPYTYSWSNGSTDPTTGLVTDGTYTLNVTDANNCFISVTHTITEPATHIKGNINSFTMPLCYGNSDGTAILSATGGLQNYTYTWSDLGNDSTQHNSTRSDLASMEYVITFEDAKGCRDTLHLDLQQPNALTTSIVTLTNGPVQTSVPCYGDNDVTVKVIHTGGTEPIQSYIWNNPSVAPNDTVDLGAGNFIVEIADANNCKATASHSITEPPLLVNTASVLNAVKCYGETGRLISTAIGGVQPYTYEWSNGSIEYNSGQIPAGDYSVKVTDDHGCENTQNITLTQPDSLIVDLIIEPDVCNDVTNGKLWAEATGGIVSVNYNFAWNTGATTDTLKNLLKQNYSIVVTDDNACVANRSIDLTTINEFEVKLAMTQVLCRGQENGKAISTPKYGNEPYSYNWSNGRTTKDLINVPEGIYTLEVTDIYDCKTSASIAVSTKPTMYIQKSGITETTCSGAIGSAYVSMASGAQPYAYLWSNGQSTDSITNLPVGYYSVKISDANGCKDSAQFYVKDTSSLQIQVSGINKKIKCAGRADGSATVVATKGTIPYSYNWSNGANTSTASDLTAGIYYIEVEDKNGCTAIDSISFIDENVLKVSIIDSSMVTCYGLDDGWALAKAQGGVGPYVTSWSNGKNTNLNTGLIEGVYTAYITDANACTVSADVQIIQPTELVTSIDKVKGIACGGECTGEARVLAFGGTAPISYKWSNNVTDSIVTNLCGGTRYVDVTDAHGCTVKETVVIYDTIPQLGLVSFKSNPDCGIANGEIAVVPFGGVKPYLYLWSNNSTDSLIQNVFSNSYSLNIKDKKGCEFDTILTLNDNSTMSVTFQREASTFCSDSNETYRAIAANGTAPYSYSWSNGDTNDVADSLTTKQYAVNITDDNGCKYSSVLDVEVKHIEINLVNSTNIDCYSDSTGSIEVIATNGVGTNYSYKWSNDSVGALVQNIPAGTYSVTATETQTGCPITKQFTITENPKIQPYFVTDQPSYCLDSTGIIHAEVLGGVAPYTYSWETGETSYILDSAWNDYIGITITDSKSCTIKDSAKVDDISNFSASEKSRYLISCLDDSDGKLEVALNNGFAPFTYSWNHNAALNSAVATDLAKGIYSITIVDSKNCEISYTFPPLTNPDTMKYVLVETTPIYCNEGTGTIRANISGGHPGYTFSWTLNNTNLTTDLLDATDIPSGNLTVSAIDSRGCKSDTISYFMSEPPKISAEFSVKLTGCGSQANTGEITVDTIFGANPPYRFMWHDEDTTTWYDGITNITKTGIAEGEYEFKIIDSLGICHNEFSNHTYPIVVFDIDTVINPTHCNYYTLDEMDSNTPNGSIEITQIITKEKNYSDSSLFDTLVIFNNYDISWEDSRSQTAKRASRLTEGQYFVSLTGQNECVTRFNAGYVDALVSITNKIESVDDAKTDRISICLEDSIQLQAKTSVSYTNSYVPTNDTFDYNWTNIANNKSARLSQNTGNQIWVNPLTDFYRDSTIIAMQYMFDGCSSSSDTLRINHYDSLDFALQVVDNFDNYVGDDSVFAIINETFIINPTEEPWYVWKADDQDGIVSINWSSLNKTKTEQGQVPDTITNEASYLSSDVYGLSVKAKEASYYYAIATTTHGCKESAHVAVNVYESSYISNLITPNGDGENDTWIIPYLYMCPDATVSIYNRWGVKVYESKSNYYLNPWGGTNNNGKLLPMSAYYYLIEYNDKYDTKPSAGTISILY